MHMPLAACRSALALFLVEKYSLTDSRPALAAFVCTVGTAGAAGTRCPGRASPASRHVLSVSVACLPQSTRAQAARRLHAHGMHTPAEC